MDWRMWVLAGLIAATGCTGARPNPPPAATINDDAPLQAAVEAWITRRLSTERLLVERLPLPNG